MKSVSSLVEKVDKGKYVIPKFQRGYEWNPGLVCDLFQSILQKYYTGLLLFWNLDRKKAEDEDWEAIWGSEAADVPERAVLDGQQRLSSLYYAIYNPEKTFPNRKSYYKFTIDLDRILNGEFEDAVDYIYSSNHHPWGEMRSEREKWLQSGKVPLSILSASDPNDLHSDYIDSQEFEKWINDYLEDRKNNPERRSVPETTTVHSVYMIFKNILNYKFVVYPLSNDRNVEDIANIFARTNQKGMRLSTFDLMNAFLYPKQVYLRTELWENFENEELKTIDSSMNEYLLKLISLFKQNYCTPNYIYNLIPGKEVEVKDSEGRRKTRVIVESPGEFEDLWNKACKYAEEARQKIMNTGDKEFGAIKPDFIPNSTIIPVLGSILWKYNEFDNGIGEIDFQNKLKKWYWSSILSGDYGRSSNSVMSKDFREWSSFLAGDKEEIERVNEFDPTFIEDELDLSEVGKGSARYRAIISMLALNKAEDFFKGRVIGTGDYSKEKINDHHIFPRNTKGLDPEKSEKFDSCKDSILNRTLLLNETNKRIKDKKPSEYLKEVLGKVEGDERRLLERMKTHFISERALEYLQEDNFDKFIEEREISIKRYMKEILGLEEQLKVDDL